MVMAIEENRTLPMPVTEEISSMKANCLSTSYEIIGLGRGCRMDKENLQPMHLESGSGKKKDANNELSKSEIVRDEMQAAVRQIYVQNKPIRTLINIEIQFDPMQYDLLKELSYRDGLDDPNKISKLQLESFVEKAVREKIDRCLRDYANLGEIYSRKLQRKHKHLVTLKEVPNPDSPGGLGTRLVPLDYEQKKREIAGFS
jgi:hypothetical protein